MTITVTALRGPALSSTYKSNTTNVPENMVYEPDALIILKDDKITEFGPAQRLHNRIPKGALIKSFRDCRIIKTVINSK